MHLHEYQSKKLLAEHSIPCPSWAVIDHIGQLDAALVELGTDQVVVKAQVHAGGRGKAGGVRLCRGMHEARAAVQDILGRPLVTAQTGSRGIMVDRVLLTPITPIDSESYLAIMVDRQSATAVMLLSSEGGVEIEQLAQSRPEALLRLRLPADGRLRRYQILNALHHMGWHTPELAAEAESLLQGLADLFINYDCELVEINPMVVSNGKLLALDAKISIDDNALFRQKQVAAYFDPAQLSPQEVQARAHDLSYIALEGQIGCLVNGAGLAMATMDMISQAGGQPANFLDVGGAATEEAVTQAFTLLANDQQVRSILVNIFGGIVSCVTIARALVHSVQKLAIQQPIVVRLEGNEVEDARDLLVHSGLKIHAVAGLHEAASLAVTLAEGV